jgi:hypothetical protein
MYRQPAATASLLYDRLELAGTIKVSSIPTHAFLGRLGSRGSTGVPTPTGVHSSIRRRPTPRSEQDSFCPATRLAGGPARLMQRTGAVGRLVATRRALPVSEAPPPLPRRGFSPPPILSLHPPLARVVRPECIQVGQVAHAQCWAG